MMNYQYFILLLLGLATGCGNDDDAPEVEYLHCLPDIEASSGPDFRNCSYTLNSDYWDACDVRFIASHQLSGLAKSYMGAYCHEAGDILTFRNQLDSEVTFTVEQKNYRRTDRPFETLEKCHSDSSGGVIACHDMEIASVWMNSDELGMELEIQVSTEPYRELPTTGQVMDVLRVIRRISESTYLYEANIAVNRRSLDYAVYLTSESYDTIVLNGRIYRDVVSSDVNQTTRIRYKYYLDQSHGLIGIHDLETDLLWTLKE